MELVRGYNRLLKTNPLLTRSTTAFFIAFNGDIFCQYLESKLDGKNFWDILNLRRSINLGIFGFGIVTPALHYWYKYLAVTFPGTSFRPVAIKFILDRTVIPPPLVMGFFVSQTLMNGGTWEDVKMRVNNNYINALKMNLVVWPAAMLVNFRFVPLEFQVLYANVIGFFWNIYLSFVIHKNKLKSMEFMHQPD